MVGAAFQTALLSFTAIAILVHVLRTERVSLDTILGGVCVYLLIGETFAYLFSMVELIEGRFVSRGRTFAEDPPECQSPAWPPSRADLLQLLTLTTVGYGDIVPVAPLARVLAMLEALIGQIFLATFLAFLVGNYLTRGRRMSKGDGDMKTTARQGRYHAAARFLSFAFKSFRSHRLA